jgi:hypothetical protein
MAVLLCFETEKVWNIVYKEAISGALRKKVLLALL